MASGAITGGGRNNFLLVPAGAEPTTNYVEVDAASAAFRALVRRPRFSAIGCHLDSTH
jgi:hypothetical protein